MITLATLPSKSAQEVFDYMANHMLNQGCRSVYYTPDHPEGISAYRGTNNNKCPAGALISDDEYNKDIENRGWHSLVQRGIVPRIHMDLIFDIQACHDRQMVELWPIKLTKLAKDYQLNTKVIDGIHVEGINT